MLIVTKEACDTGKYQPIRTIHRKIGEGNFKTNNQYTIKGQNKENFGSKLI